MDEGLTKNEIIDRDVIYIFWNLDDYPIPAGDSADLFLISHNIISAVRRMGLHGSIGFRVFGDEPKFDESDLYNAGIRYDPKEYEESTIDQMAWYAISSANLVTPIRFVVIAKENTDPEFLRVLNCLITRNCTVVFVEPPAPDMLFRSVDSVLSCSHRLGDANPIGPIPERPFHPSNLSGYPRDRMLWCNWA